MLALRGPDERTMRRLLDLVPLVQAATGLNVAVSAGILERSQADRLAAGGVHRYNHNLETARSFFPEIATTHTWDERYQTCVHVKEAGMQLCCGVLLGMGETAVQRLELIAQLAELAPAEVPVNFLDPRPGTPLSIRKPVRPPRSHPVDRPVPPRAPRSDPALCGRTGAHPRRAASHGNDLGHQRLDRRQLPDHPGPQPCG